MVLSLLLILKTHTHAHLVSMYFCYFISKVNYKKNQCGLVIFEIYFCRYIVWILVAAVYHLPSLQSMGVDMRMNLSLFLTISVSSILFLLVFHIIFYGLWYIGLVSRVAGKRPEILTILQNCAVSFEDTFFQKKKSSFHIAFFCHYI